MQLAEPEHEIVTLNAGLSDVEVAQSVREIILKISQGRYGKKVLLALEDPHD